MRNRFGFLGLAAASLALAACTTSQPIDPNDTGFIPGGDYVLVGMDGGAVPLRNMNIRIEENGVSGSGPCNSYQAVNNAELPAVSLSPIVSARVPCKDSAIENRFFSTLQTATSMEYYGGVLKIKSPQTWLIFERGVKAASAPSALEQARGAQ